MAENLERNLILVDSARVDAIPRGVWHIEHGVGKVLGDIGGADSGIYECR
jgi:hypothetical protein